MTPGLRAILCLSPALLAGCGAKLSSSLPASAPAASYVGVAAGTLTAATVEAEITGLQRELEAIARRASVVPVQLSRDGSVLKLSLGADQSFGPASAQLEPAALEVYAQLAQILGRRPGTVAHILVHGDAASAEPFTDLSARRAISLQGYLASRGVPGTRLRAEGRGAAEPATPGAAAVNRRIEFVLKPIIAGRETEAWAPPS